MNQIKYVNFSCDSVTPADLKVTHYPIKQGGKIKTVVLQVVDKKTGNPVRFTSSSDFRYPFGISHPYKDPDSPSKPYTFVAKITDTQFADTMKQLYHDLVSYLIEHSEIIFKKKYTEAQREVVETLCASPVKTNEYGDSVNIKILQSKTADLPESDPNYVPEGVPISAKRKKKVNKRNVYSRLRIYEREDLTVNKQTRVPYENMDTFKKLEEFINPERSLILQFGIVLYNISGKVSTSLQLFDVCTLKQTVGHDDDEPDFGGDVPECLADEADADEADTDEDVDEEDEDDDEVEDLEVDDDDDDEVVEAM